MCQLDPVLVAVLWQDIVFQPLLLVKVLISQSLPHPHSWIEEPQHYPQPLKKAHPASHILPTSPLHLLSFRHFVTDNIILKLTQAALF